MHTTHEPEPDGECTAYWNLPDGGFFCGRGPHVDLYHVAPGATMDIGAVWNASTGEGVWFCSDCGKPNFERELALEEELSGRD